MRDGERVPARLRRVIDKAMATDPKARYGSAGALANELQDFLTKRPTTLDRSRALRVALWSRRNPQLALTVLVALGLTALTVGTHVTVERLQDERAALDRKVKAQKAEKQTLNAQVVEAREQLEQTQQRLATERDSLATLEKSIAEERGSYQTLIDAKEQALLDANRSTREVLEKLDAARRERRAAADARQAAERALADLRRDNEKAGKERDKLRKERDAARTERDAAQRERDAAIADLERADSDVKRLEQELARLGHPHAAARR